MKTVLVAPQIPIAASGGIGTFVWHFSQLLRAANEDVSIILTRPPEAPPRQWLPPFENLGIDVVCVEDPSRPLHLPNGYDWYQAVSERVAELIPDDTDIVYFADWGANGFHLAQSRRFSARRLPVIVDVLHGGSAWDREGRQRWPEQYEDLSIDMRERYAAQHSDFVAAPSHYIIQWAKSKGWVLPPDDRVHVLKYPYFPPASPTEPASQPAESFERIIFFGGHIDIRKGIDLFVHALEELSDRPCMKTVKEVVLLGPGGVHELGSPPQIAQRLREKLLGVKVEALTTLSTFDAQDYLRRHAHDSLVVMPSRAETMGFTVIEASLIPNIRMLCSNTGGIPEALGPDGQAQMFKPFRKPLVNKMEQWLLAGPRLLPASARYDWEGGNRAWFGFHQRVREYARTFHQQQDQSESNVAFRHIGRIADQRSIDVCIPYYNLGAYLSDLLESLARQTTQDFNVFVVDDGSTDPKSIVMFEEMKRKYQEYEHWVFVSTENQGVCEARNLAASLGNAEYICFADPDNIAAPNMLDRFLEGIRRSGDDCLTCYMYIFAAERLAFNASDLPHPAKFHYIPLGNFPVLGMMRNPFGDGNCIIRRSVFEALGGFTTDFPHEINHEDRELLTRLSLAGYKLDVIPEYLLYYRERETSRLRTTDAFLNDMRVLRHYQARLREVGLDDLVPLLVGFNYRVEKGGFTMVEHGPSAETSPNDKQHATFLGASRSDKFARFEREFDAAASANLIDFLNKHEHFKPEVEITMEDIPSRYPYYLPLLDEDPSIAEFVGRYVDKLQPFLQAPFPLPGNRVIQGPWDGFYKLGHFATCGITAETLAGKRVLDIGCNAGFDTFYLSTLGAREVIGIEPTPLFYYQALMLWAAYNCPNLDFRRVGWQQLDETGVGKFDVINCQGVLYHEPNPLLLVETIFDHLAPGGILILETHVTMDNDMKAHFVEDAYWGDNSWWWVPSVPAVSAMLRVYGFENIILHAHYPMDSRNPEDATRTPEGNPAGGRALLTATRPHTPTIHRPKVGWSKP